MLLGYVGRRAVVEQLAAAATVVVCFHAAVSTAQTPRPAAQPTFRAEVNLVEVVAVVTGDDDRSLGDLAASDFEVLEDGSARTLVSVRKLSAESRNAAAVAPGTAAPPAYVERLPTSTASADAPAFVLLLDDLDTSPRDSHRVIRAGERALSFIPDSALVSVLTTSGLGGSLLTLEPPGPQHASKVKAFRGQLLIRALPPEGLGSAPGAGGRRMGGDCMTGTPSLDCQDPTRPARRASAVAAAAEILGRSGARRKVLLWVAQTMGVSTIDPQGSRAAQRQALASALNNDISVYVLDPRENPGTDDPPDTRRTGGALEVGGSAMALDVDDMTAVPLTQLTRETGGRYITMANNLGDFMGRIIEQNSTAYLLVYESPVSRTPGRHRIDVRVKRPGARVSARRGYIVDAPASAEGTPTAASDDSLLRRTLLGSAPQGQLRLIVHAVPRFATGKTGSVSVTVRADGAKEPLSQPVDVLLATFDDEGRATNQHQVRLDPPAAGLPLEFTTELPLTRGRHQLRVAAVTGDATKTGLVITPVDVIEPGRQLMMAPPLLLQPSGDRVIPTAARRFAAGTSLGVQAEIAGRPVQEGKVAVRVSMADSSGAVVRTADGALDPGGSPDRQRATGVIKTTGLANGAYLLILEAVPPNASDAVRHAIPIVLHAATSSTAGSSHLVVAHGPSSRHPAAGTFVIRTEEEWLAFWKLLPTRQAPPSIDFSRATLFAIVAGAAENATAHKPVVVSIDAMDGETVVRWRAEPDASPGAQHAFTVVAVPARVDNVRFEPSR
ncbi:VWA domain-containing protein [Luteitalea sp.]|uniref:VWA domain-containing protein n=1 Tax=Luteitalea sp. TaxID=2004800 RepID=UPI0025BA81A8|nr:VWA domain-containing protein [Luteitalea sp.]